MNFSVQVLCCAAPLLMVKASSYRKQLLLIPDYLLAITFAHKCPMRTSRLLTSLDSQLLTIQHNLQVAPLHLDSSATSVPTSVSAWTEQKESPGFTEASLLSRLDTHYAHVLSDNEAFNMLCNTRLCCSSVLCPHAGGVDCAVVSLDAGRVFSIGSKGVQVSAWVLSRIMGVSGSSVPSSFSAHHSLKNFISLIWFFFVRSQI